MSKCSKYLNEAGELERQDKRTADDVLDDWLTDDQIKNANSLFLADLLGLMEMQDESIIFGEVREDENIVANHIRNKLRKELRQAMALYFMGTVGGDSMGSSQDNSTPTAQGHEAGNLSAGGTT